MKKILFNSIFMAWCAVSMFAQLKVASNGNVSVLSTGIPLSPLSIRGIGDTTKTVDINAINFTTGLWVNREGSPAITGQTWMQALSAKTGIYPGSICFGVRGTSWEPAPQNTGRAFGVYGLAGNSTSGYNYGVLGSIVIPQNGAGIVGTDDHSVMSPYINGRYAGYFVGNVRVTGTVNGTLVQNSDIRYKQNIIELGDLSTSRTSARPTNNTVLNSLLEMTPVQYNMKQVYFEPESDTVNIKRGYFDEESQLFQKKHYGLIAQDLQKLYPDLVYEEASGYLAVDYTGLIPLLIQSVKELNAKIEALEEGGGSIGSQKAPRFDSPENNTNVPNAMLYQNTPNPFFQSTRISYYLSETVGTAQLCIYDLQGKQLKQIVITERGEGSQTISGSEFKAGIYLYALLADGREVDVKRMILTE